MDLLHLAPEIQERILCPNSDVGPKIPESQVRSICVSRILETVAILELLNSVYHPRTIDMTLLIFGASRMVKIFSRPITHDCH